MEFVLTDTNHLVCARVNPYSPHRAQNSFSQIIRFKDLQYDHYLLPSKMAFLLSNIKKSGDLLSCLLKIAFLVILKNKQLWSESGIQNEPW